VTIFAWVEGDRVYTESKFSGGRKAKNAAVAVYDKDGNRLLEGKTDENGEFDFKIPKKTELKVVLSAGMGHRGEWTIPMEEIAPGMPPQPLPDMPAETESPKKDDPPQPAPPSGPTLEEVQTAVETALDKKLKPLFKLVAESRQQEPSLSDILGGIGYIAGLVGVAAYVNSRKKK
jgi:nickel transport protein